jgi:hypothetical protein
MSSKDAKTGLSSWGTVSEQWDNEIDTLLLIILMSQKPRQG